jgi:hypothetical protein
MMDVHILCMSQPLYRFLSRKDMFPSKDSCLHAAVSSSNGCGYRALKNILFPSHSAFHDQPSIMIKSYPRQKSTDDLLRYFQLFCNFLQLRTYITDNPAMLDNPTEALSTISRSTPRTSTELPAMNVTCLRSVPSTVALSSLRLSKRSSSPRIALLLLLKLLHRHQRLLLLLLGLSPAARFCSPCCSHSTVDCCHL